MATLKEQMRGVVQETREIRDTLAQLQTTGDGVSIPAIVNAMDKIAATIGDVATAIQNENFKK